MSVRARLLIAALAFACGIAAVIVVVLLARSVLG
jgi:hypothetical protein